MKKSLFMNNLKTLIISISIFLIACTTAFAQDVITTAKAEKISAKITEVDVDFIKYKLFDYQEGPTYTLKKTDIDSIVYQNGTVAVFEKHAEPAVSQAPSDSRISPSIASDYLYFKMLNDKEMAKFLKDNDAESYRIFRSGQRMKAAGKGLLAFGIIFTLGGAALIPVNIFFLQMPLLTTIGYISIGAGQAFILTGIPLMAVGGVKKGKGKTTYENKYFKNQSATLNFNINSNGVGFSLKF